MKTSLRFAALGIAFVLPAPFVDAQIAPPGSRRIPWPRPMPPQNTTSDLQLESQRARVEIGAGMARVKLNQTFLNPQNQQIEGTYLWAVPSGAAIDDLAVTLGGKKLQAEILDADRARQIYTGIVQKLRDPAILEFVGRDLVRARIFPVPANGRVEVELSYSQPLKGNRFDLPFRAPGSSGTTKASVEIALNGADLKGIFSPTHTIETKRHSSGANLSGEWASTNRDFSLLWTRGEGAVALQALTYRVPGESDGFFLLLAAPDSRQSEAEIQAKDVTFVFDTSGSMEGPKIEQARAALRTLLGNLRPNDRFNIVLFSSDVRPWKPNLVSSTKENLKEARAFVDEIRAIGGTNISEALETALKMQQEPLGALPTSARISRPRQIVFLTDGQPTVGEVNVETIIKNAATENQNRARIFSFGVGFDVNARLLDSLAEDNRGSADYVLPEQDIERVVGDLYAKIAFPTLSDVKLESGETEIYDVFPRRMPDLTKGGQVVVMGRFRGSSTKPISLVGTRGGKTERFSGQFTSGGTADLPRLWATRKVGFLIDDARRANRPLDGEVRSEILALSKKYGVVTPLTAALITEDSPLAVAGMRRGRFGNSTSAAGATNGVPILGDVPLVGGLFRSNNAGFAAEAGRDAVLTSKATRELREGVTPERQIGSASVVAGGKTFVLRADAQNREVWTDSAFDAAIHKSRVVKFASTEYFALLKDSNVAAWLALGNNVVWVQNGEAIRVESE